MDAFISDTLIRSQHLSNHNYVTYHLDTTTSHDSHVVSVTVELLSLLRLVIRTCSMLRIPSEFIGN